MTNRLGGEKSPYLLQHAENPVDWYPWGDEAFLKAREEDKPIFLSIGYATCHWCHVMEHESFENEHVARLLNTHMVSIKVDREERPDIDHIYMSVCQTLTGGGGWPLSIFMTSERKPFFAGTYFPRLGRGGMPGFTDIISQIAELWRNDRERVLKAGESITAAIQPQKTAWQGSTLGPETLENAYLQFRKSFDPQWGGFGKAPKFPTPHHLTFLLRYFQRNPRSEALAIVEKTLDAVRNGGIFDQVGFGFHRYSVDERWLVPHFEKMLYDQALLAMAYTEAFLVTGKERYAQVTREIFEYVLRDMTSPEGGFYSAEDADSEGQEGLFYVWTPREVQEVLGEELGSLFCRFYDITPPGNFEGGKSIAHVSKSPEVFARMMEMGRDDVEQRLEDSRQKLFAARKNRVHPLKDDKILTSWNALMIAALAKGYQALGDSVYLDAASRSARFLLTELRRDSGTLFRRYRHGAVAHDGYLDDYAFLAWGLLELYESTFAVHWLEEAVGITRRMLDLFEDEEGGGFFYTSRESEGHIVRPKEIYDGAIPSSNSVALLILLRLGRMTGSTEWEEKADRLMKAFAATVKDYPSGYAQFLNGLDFALGPSREVVIAGARDDSRTKAMVKTLHRQFFPNRVLLLRGPGAEGEALAALCPHVHPLLPIDDQPAVYLCENYACRKPITDLAELGV